MTDRPAICDAITARITAYEELSAWLAQHPDLSPRPKIAVTGATIVADHDASADLRDYIVAHANGRRVTQTRGTTGGYWVELHFPPGVTLWLIADPAKRDASDVTVLAEATR